jgi:hypothetical protein
MTNPTVQWMIANSVPLTRANYLAAAYMGNPPAEIDGELLAEIPIEILRAELPAKCIVSIVFKALVERSHARFLGH